MASLSGRIAQLGERLPYKQNVGSSSLSTPTTNSFFFLLFYLPLLLQLQFFSVVIFGCSK